MNKYLKYIKEFQGDNEYGKYFINNQLKVYLESNQENQSDIEHILDFVYSNKKIYKSISYKTMLEKANAWTKKLNAKASKKDTEKQGKDYEVIKKWRGYKMVKLLSKSAYTREGKLMSHCVASYYNKDDEIYSLRDSKNLPHATLSKSSQQIKGKGNGSINPKYIRYVVEFLESIDIQVRDSEMANLGYVNISKVNGVEFPKSSIFRENYFFGGDLHKIKGDVDTLEMIEVFGFIEQDNDYKCKSLFNIEEAVRKTVGNTTGDDSKFSTGDDSKFSTGYRSEFSAGDNSKFSAGNFSSFSAGYESKFSTGHNSKFSAGNFSSFSAGYESKFSTGDNSKFSAGNFSSFSAGYESKFSTGDNSKFSTGYRSEFSAGDNSKFSAGNFSSFSAGYESKFSTGHNSKFSAGNFSSFSAGYESKFSTGDNSNFSTGADSEFSVGNHSQFESTGQNSKYTVKRGSLGISGHRSKAKGEIGCWLTFSEWGPVDDGYDIIGIKSIKIDGHKYKPGIFYMLKEGKIIEAKGEEV